MAYYVYHDRTVWYTRPGARVALTERARERQRAYGTAVGGKFPVYG